MLFWADHAAFDKDTSESPQGPDLVRPAHGEHGIWQLKPVESLSSSVLSDRLQDSNDVIGIFVLEYSIESTCVEVSVRWFVEF